MNKFSNVMLLLRSMPSKQMVSKKLARFKGPSCVFPESLGEAQERPDTTDNHPEAVCNRIKIAQIAGIQESERGRVHWLRARHIHSRWAGGPRTGRR